MHSCFLQSPPNDSHLLTVLCISPKRRWGTASGNEWEVSKHKIYVLPSLRCFREVGISTWNSMSVFCPYLFQCLLVGKMELRNRMVSSFFSYYFGIGRFLGLGLTERGLTRRNTDNGKISSAWLRIHTRWLIIVLSIKAIDAHWAILDVLSTVDNGKSNIDEWL